MMSLLEWVWYPSWCIYTQFYCITLHALNVIYLEKWSPKHRCLFMLSTGDMTQYLIGESLSTWDLALTYSSIKWCAMSLVLSILRRSFPYIFIYIVNCFFNIWKSIDSFNICTFFLWDMVWTQTVIWVWKLNF